MVTALVCDVISMYKIALVFSLQGIDSDLELESFLMEGLVMKDFDHKNVLSLLGVSVDPTGAPMIVLPFMTHGNLKSYISNESNQVELYNQHSVC